jgi:hypothetical protein
MSCDTDFEVLMAYLDGELSPVERGRVAEHVVGCATCRETVEDLRAVSGALTKWSVPEPATLPTARDLLDRAGVPAQAAVSEAPASRWSEVVRRWGAAAALLLVAATIGTVVLTRTGSHQSDVASVEQPSTAPPASPAPPSAQSDKSNAGAQYVEPGPTTSTSTANVNPESPAAAKAPAEKQEQPAAAGGEAVDVVAGDAPATPVTTPGPEAAKPAPTDDARTKDVERTETAAAPPPPAQPEVASGADEAKRDGNRGAFGQAAPGRALSGAKEIRTARLTLETGGLEATVGNIESAARAAGGRLVSRGAVNETSGGRQTVVQIVVDADEFDAAVNRIKGLGKVKSEFRTSREANAQLAEEDRDSQDKKQKTAKAGTADTRRRDQLEAQSTTATIVVTIVEPK